MDDVAWDASQTVANMPVLWSTTRQHDIEEAGYSYGYSTPNLDSSVVHGLNHMQETQKPVRTDHLSICSNSLSVYDFMPDFNIMPHHHHHHQQQLMNGGASQNDVTQDDDDGNISAMILPDGGRSLWSFGAVSTGDESRSNASASAANSIGNTRKKEDLQCLVNEVDDTASQSTYSPHPYQYAVNQSKIFESGRKNRDMQCHVNGLDDTVSHSTYSSHPCVVNQGKIVESKPDCAKRSFRLISESDNNNPAKPKRPRWDHPNRPSSSNINFQQPNSCISSNYWNSSTEEAETKAEADPGAIAHMKEMIYRAAAFRPVNIGLEVVEKPRRKNVRISSDPQTVAARQRRERISERIRVLQKMVPGGSKMDTASMLDEAANYLKFLRSQVKALESLGNNKKNISDSINSAPFSFVINPSCPHI